MNENSEGALRAEVADLRKLVNLHSEVLKTHMGLIGAVNQMVEALNRMALAQGEAISRVHTTVSTNEARRRNEFAMLEAIGRSVIAALSGDDHENAYRKCMEHFKATNAEIFDPEVWDVKPDWLVKAMQR